MTTSDEYAPAVKSRGVPGGKPGRCIEFIKTSEYS
jgi:hypothetical protein